jgi:hypothetical protein
MKAQQVGQLDVTIDLLRPQFYGQAETGDGLSVLTLLLVKAALKSLRRGIPGVGFTQDLEVFPGKFEVSGF